MYIKSTHAAILTQFLFSELQFLTIKIIKNCLSHIEWAFNDSYLGKLSACCKCFQQNLLILHICPNDSL